MVNKDFKVSADKRINESSCVLESVRKKIRLYILYVSERIQETVADGIGLVSQDLKKQQDERHGQDQPGLVVFGLFRAFRGIDQVFLALVEIVFRFLRTLVDLKDLLLLVLH